MLNSLMQDQYKSLIKFDLPASLGDTSRYSEIVNAEASRLAAMAMRTLSTGPPLSDPIGPGEAV